MSLDLKLIALVGAAVLLLSGVASAQPQDAPQDAPSIVVAEPGTATSEVSVNGAVAVEVEEAARSTRPVQPLLQISPGEPLSLQEAVAVALEHNPSIRIARENYRRAGGAVVEARGASRLDLGITATYTRFDKVEQAEIGGGQTITLGEIDSRQAVASLTQPIDLSGILGAAIDAAEYRRLAAEFDLRTTQHELALAAESAYLAVLEARETARVAGESVARLQEYVELAQIRLNAGAAPEFDVLRAETELANARQTQLLAENGIRLAEAQLANVLGVRLPRPVPLEDPEVPAQTLPGLPEMIEEGLQARPESLSAEAIVQAADRGIHIARRGLRPTMAVTANYRYNGNTTLFQPREFTADAMLVLNLPLLDMGVTRGRVQQAEADREIARAASEQTDLQIRLEVEQSYVSVENARERLAAAEATLQEAAEALRLARVRYDAGVSIGVEVTDAEVAYTSAETNVVNARYDLLLARARLARAVGRPLSIGG